MKQFEGVDVNQADGDDWTALQLAAYTGQLEAAQWQVDVAGAAVERGRKNGCTPLFVACEAGNEVAQYLIGKGADLNKARDSGATSLYIGTENGHIVVVELLIAAGADLNKSNNKGTTPLWIGAQNGHEAVVESLIAAGADLNKANNNGVTPLWIGAQNGHEAVVASLIAAGADLNKAMNTTGWTALRISASNGSEAVVKLLIDAGADLFHNDTGNGTKPLQDAEQRGHEAAAQLLRDAERRALAAAAFYRAALLVHTISRRTPLLRLAEALCDEPTLARLTEAERARLFSLSRSAPSFRATRAPLLASFTNRCARLHWLRASNPFATAALYSSSLLVYRTLRRAPFDAITLQKIAEALARADCALLYQLDERERTQLFSAARVTHAVRMQRKPQLEALDGWRAHMDWLRELTTGYEKDDFETLGPIKIK